LQKSSANDFQFKFSGTPSKQVYGFMFDVINATKIFSSFRLVFNSFPAKKGLESSGVFPHVVRTSRRRSQLGAVDTLSQKTS